MMNMNMGINIGMNNMNQIYTQMSQLMTQIINSINIVVTNMDKMNKLINEIGNNQINNNINNFNNMNNMINFNPMIFNNQIKYDFVILFEKNGLNREISSIQCNSKDKLSDVIKKYELKTDVKGKNKYTDIFIEKYK